MNICQVSFIIQKSEEEITGSVSSKTMPYNKLLTNLACSSRTGEYWPSVVFVRTSLRSVRTATTLGQYSPVRPSRSVSKKLIAALNSFCPSWVSEIKILDLHFQAFEGRPGHFGFSHGSLPQSGSTSTEAWHRLVFNINPSVHESVHENNHNPLLCFMCRWDIKVHSNKGEIPFYICINSRWSTCFIFTWILDPGFSGVDTFDRRGHNFWLCIRVLHVNIWFFFSVQTRSTLHTSFQT